MQRIYSYILETSHAFRVRVAGIHVMPFPIISLLRFYITTSRNMCSGPIVFASHCTMLQYLPSMLLICILTDFAMVPVAPIVSVLFVHFTRNVFL